MPTTNEGEIVSLIIFFGRGMNDGEDAEHRHLVIRAFQQLRVPLQQLCTNCKEICRLAAYPPSTMQGCLPPFKEEVLSLANIHISLQAMIRETVCVAAAGAAATTAACQPKGRNGVIIALHACMA